MTLEERSLTSGELEIVDWMGFSDGLLHVISQRCEEWGILVYGDWFRHLDTFISGVGDIAFLLCGIWLSDLGVISWSLRGVEGVITE